MINNVVLCYNISMKEAEIKKFLIALQEAFFLFAPQKQGEILKVKEVKNIAEINWSGQIPFNSFKFLFFPFQEKLFGFSGGRLKEIAGQYPPVAAVNINVLDLKALTLYNEVFTNDVYYQRRRQKMFLIGYSADWPADYKKYKIFSSIQEEKILEHLVFDVFFIKQKNKQFKVYSGSEKGQALLEKLGLKEYQHLAFAGATAESGPEAHLLALKKKVENSQGKKIWNELDKICLACGKCSMICPTCFCFNLFDRHNPENLVRERLTTTCFYPDFSLIAGGHQPLKTVKDKIYFWYVHKFVRIPKEYGLPGCVGCGRCSQVCPVGIKIKEVIEKL